MFFYAFMVQKKAYMSYMPYMVQKKLYGKQKQIKQDG
jgi:hypothetical protein